MTPIEAARVRMHALTALESTAIIYWTVAAEGEIHDLTMKAMIATRAVASYLMQHAKDHYDGA